MVLRGNPGYSIKFIKLFRCLVGGLMSPPYEDKRSFIVPSRF